MLTPEDSSKGGFARAAKYAELREQARREAIEQLAGMSTKALRRLELLLEADADSDAYRAVKDVLDRVLGRPTQAVELTGEEGGPVEIEHKGVSLSDVLRVAGRTGASGDPGRES